MDGRPKRGENENAFSVDVASVTTSRLVLNSPISCGRHGADAHGDANLG